MSFRVWFVNWIRAFCKLMTLDYRKPKSDSQRRRERERRLKAKHSNANLFRAKKKYKKRRSGMAIQNEKLLNGLFGFIGASLGILLLPFGLFDWGRKSAKARRASRHGDGGTRKTTPTLAAKTGQKKPKMQTSHTSANASVTAMPTENTKAVPRRSIEFSDLNAATPVVKPSLVNESDENTPKSTPKNEKDRYIRKRMLIAGSHYCDQDVLDTLQIGSHIDLEAEPDNPYDKDAVKLLFNGQKIGYIAKKDHMAFVTCLKLKRKMYGVITAIIEEDGQTKYEYETWFDSER